jgi:hypothetical protein
MHWHDNYRGLHLSITAIGARALDLKRVREREMLNRQRQSSLLSYEGSSP